MGGAPIPAFPAIRVRIYMGIAKQVKEPEKDAEMVIDYSPVVMG